MSSEHPDGMTVISPMLSPKKIPFWVFPPQLENTLEVEKFPVWLPCKLHTGKGWLPMTTRIPDRLADLAPCWRMQTPPRMTGTSLALLEAPTSEGRHSDNHNASIVIKHTHDFNTRSELATGLYFKF